MAEVKYIVFLLGNQKYGVRLDRINGIEQIYNIVPIPVGAEYIKGIIHLRKEVIPIYDLKGHFNIHEEADVKNTQLLVSETHGIKLGIEVDNVLGIVPIKEENVKKVPIVVKGDDTSYIENVISTNLYSGNGEEEIMLTVAIDNIMSDADFDNVASALEDTE